MLQLKNGRINYVEELGYIIVQLIIKYLVFFFNDVY